MNPIYDQATIRPENSIGYLLNQARLELYYAVDRELSDLDVTSAQFGVMARLAYGMADSPGALCKALQYDPGAMTRMMDRLEAKGLIRRTRDRNGDRRAVHLELTEQGKQMFPVIQARVIGVLNRMLTGFSADEAKQFEGFLKRLIANA
ncbi:MAG: MarR family transcriptional regulator [Proteobacteria bacterium]|nr:MarR family transcriptional regulator [Pseudomonadota bacterium]